MKFGLSLIMRGEAATPEAFATLAERAEQLQMDSLWVSDHLVLPPLKTSKYPGTPDGKPPKTWLERYWECFLALTYVGARTHKIKLGTSVCILPMRNPIQTAKEVAVLDQLTGGRFIFGVGVGWYREEFEMLGQSFSRRGAYTDEALDICKKLWTEDAPSHEGRFFQFDKPVFQPKPAQHPHPPIWIAGHSPAALKRVARIGDGWHPMRSTPESLAEQLPLLRREMEAAGRDLAELQIGIKCQLKLSDSPLSDPPQPLQGSPQQVADALKRFAELGVHHVTLDFDPETLETGLEQLERFCQEVRPKL